MQEQHFVGTDPVSPFGAPQDACLACQSTGLCTQMIGPKEDRHVLSHRVRGLDHAGDYARRDSLLDGLYRAV